MPEITIEQLKDGLRIIRQKGAVMLTIAAETIPELVGDHPFKGKAVVKFYTANFLLGIDYPSDGPHAWATYVDKCIVSNRDGTREYLRLVERSRILERFIIDGRETPTQEVLPWVRPSRGNRRNVALDNIHSITWGGETYMIL